MSASENKEAVFIAKVTAGVTHEIRNVFAIVKESAGLVEDMIGLSCEGRPIKSSQLERIVERIDKQIARGVEIMSALNTFAHTLDETDEEVDLVQSVKRAAFFCDRYAKKKRQSISVSSSCLSITANVNPLKIQMVLFSAMECCIEQLSAGSEIEVSIGQKGDDAIVAFFAKNPSENAETTAVAGVSVDNELKNLVQDTGAMLDTDDISACFGIVFSAKSLKLNIGGNDG